MQNAFTGLTLDRAVRAATHDYRHRLPQNKIERKGGVISLIAPPRNWSQWRVLGPLWGGRNSPAGFRTMKVSFGISGNFQSTFDVELKGGDQLVHAIGPGRATVVLTGEQMSEISIRVRSHSVPLAIRVTYIT